MNKWHKTVSILKNTFILKCLKSIIWHYPFGAMVNNEIWLWGGNIIAFPFHVCKSCRELFWDWCPVSMSGDHLMWVSIICGKIYRCQMINVKGLFKSRVKILQCWLILWNLNWGTYHLFIRSFKIMSWQRDDFSESKVSSPAQMSIRYLFGVVGWKCLHVLWYCFWLPNFPQDPKSSHQQH